jgi:hypothetical protein
MLDNKQRYLPADKTFKRVVLAATALALAFVVGSAACVQRGPADQMTFAWHWSVMLWGLGAAASAWPFWRLVWAVQERPTRRTKTQLVLYCIGLLALGLGAFLYPSRFGSVILRSDAFEGLALAAVFLLVGACLLFALSRALSRDDNLPEK